MKDNTEIKNIVTEENVLYSLWLTGLGSSNAATGIDAIREITGVTYSPANDLYMSKLPECVKTQMSKDDAEKALKILQATGAKAEIRIAGENDDKKMAALIAKYAKPNCQSLKSNFKETFVAFLVAFAVVLLFFFGCDQQKIDSIDLDYSVKMIIEEQFIKGAEVSECKLKKLPKDRFEGTVVIKRDGTPAEKVNISGYLDDTRQLIVQIDDLKYLVYNDVKAIIEEQLIKNSTVSDIKLEKLPNNRFAGTVVIKRGGMSSQTVKVSGFLDDKNQVFVQIDDLKFLVCNHVLDVAKENNISCQITNCILNENPDKTFTGTVTARFTDGTFEYVKVKGNCNNNGVYVEVVQ